MPVNKNEHRSSDDLDDSKVAMNISGVQNVIFFLKYLYTTIGLKMLVWVCLVVFAALLDGLTVGLFLPILEGSESDNRFSNYIRKAFDVFGIQYSLGAVLLVMVMFYILRSSFMIAQSMYVSRIITRLLIQLKSGLVTKIFESKYQYFATKESGYFINAATIEYDRITSACEKCMQLVVSSGFAIVYFAMPMFVNPVLTLAILLFGIPALYFLQKANKLTKEYSIAATGINIQLQTYLIQALRSYKYLKATNSSKNIVNKTVQTAQDQGELSYKQSVLSTIISNGTELVLLLMVVSILFYYVQVKAVVLIEVLFLLFLLKRAVGFALASYTDYRKFLSSSGSIRVFMALETDLELEKEEMISSGIDPDFEKQLRFEGVSFSYSDRTEVLKEINLIIEPKTTIAVVGASGSGKSTLVTLLTGVIQPVRGGLYLGADSYTDLNQSILRKGIGYVTQESVIFNDTIRSNITMWQPNVAEEVVRSVCAKANILDFIDSLPDGFETRLGDDGINISGGQRQRISIARELFKEVELLIFDEATSALDTESEKEIQNNLDDLRGEKTIILIAHRLSTVRNSDMVYVLKGGRILENGSYNDLMSAGGEFKAMVDLQALTDDSIELPTGN